MKKFLIALSVLLIASTVISAPIVEITDHGYYMDGRGQIPEYDKIPPPHPENIPTRSMLVRPIESFKTYKKYTIDGYRRPLYKTPMIPGYNMQFSDRETEYYTKDQYVQVWCSGDSYIEGVDCLTKSHVITFGSVKNWPILVAKAPIKARKFKSTGRKTALYLYVKDITTDIEYISGARNWARQYSMPIFFVTIDSMIPQSYIN